LEARCKDQWRLIDVFEEIDVSGKIR